MTASGSQRNTEQKTAIKSALLESSNFISAQGLHAVMKARGSSVGLATVYRNLNEMARTGDADVLHAGTDGQLFRSCDEGHHHHLLCVECGRTIQVTGLQEEWVERLARDAGFTVLRHVVEIFGVCSACQAVARGESTVGA